MEVKRQIAYKLCIKDIASGKYNKVEGEWEPNYVQVGDKKVSRVNLIAVVVSNEGSAIVEDGTGRIELRAFSDSLQGIVPGDVILAIGRPREFNNSIYIVPEIVRKLSPDWLELRRKETSIPELTVQEKVLNAIRALDAGQGAETEAVMKASGTGDEIIQALLRDGEIFQVKHGRLKVL